MAIQKIILRSSFLTISLNEAHTKPQHSQYKHTPIQHGPKVQHCPALDTSTLLDDAGVKRIQDIVGTLLWYDRDINSKLLVSLNTIGSQLAVTTEDTNAAITIDQLLDYITTYPNDGIAYRNSSMLLTGNVDNRFLN